MHNHIACGFGYKVVCIDDRFTKDVVIYRVSKTSRVSRQASETSRPNARERGNDYVNKFISAILDDNEYCKKIMKYHFNKSLIMPIEEEELFQEANKCWICDRLFELTNEKVRDHCHVTGKFRGAAHFSCNANFKITKRVPVIFHNLKGCDGHLIMKELSNFDVVIDVTPYGLEKYKAIIVNRNIVFIDSMQFMEDSLGDLVKNLDKGDFKYLSREFSAKHVKLIKQKGVYPYEYMNSFKRFDECKIPSKDKFYSSLKDKGISDEDYERAIDVWNTFNIKSLGEYHDLYLKTDVLLLCDVFEKFINICVEYYELDPCHYINIPELAWDAMLKMTGVNLRLIDDIDKHLFIEKGMRGGVSCITRRYCKANNKYVKNYDKDKENTYISYWDVNNLCGWAMSQYLPYDNFEWMSEEEINEVNFDLVSEDSKIGYVLEVDLEYPKDLHDTHNDYPLAPEKLRVSENMLSDYCLDIVKNYGIKVGEVNKLTPNLKDKNGYVIHYKNLQMYKSLGMKVVKIHRVLKFSQMDWLKDFVMFNTRKRMKATNMHEKDYFKLMVNSVYGKSIENLRKRINVKLVNNKENYLEYTSQPTFVSQKIFDKNIVAIHRVKPVLLLNKTIYIGFFCS